MGQLALFSVPVESRIERTRRLARERQRTRRRQRAFVHAVAEPNVRRGPGVIRLCGRRISHGRYSNNRVVI
jgi:hypothetical protein